MSVRTPVAFLLGIFVCAMPIPAGAKERASRLETVKATIDGNELTIVYERPSIKDPKTGAERTIWGGVVPYGKVWWMGVNQAPLFTTKKDIILGGKTIAAGTYSLYMVPEEKGGKLILNKQTGPGRTKYDQAQDLVRLNLEEGPMFDAVDKFTISIDRNSGGVGGGRLSITWVDVVYSAQLKTKK
ncbi:MAG TPA: DUF2911 domain-containing protein [Chthoniobacterales bacterium]|nr:DUF2911 domain-containing protein [Chthoniobacterales bacterium]